MPVTASNEFVVIDYINGLPDLTFTPVGSKTPQKMHQPINLHTHGLTVRPEGNGDAQHRLAYTVKYATVSAPFTAGSATVTDVSAAVGGTGTVNKAVTIGYTGATPALSQATDYTDTLTFTMTAK